MKRLPIFVIESLAVPAELSAIEHSLFSLTQKHTQFGGADHQRNPA